MEARQAAKLLNRLILVRDELNKAQDYNGSVIDKADDFDEDLLTVITDLADRHGCVAFPDVDGNGVVATKENYDEYKSIADVRSIGYGDWLMSCLTSVTEETEMQDLMDLVHDFIVWHVDFDKIKSWLTEATNDRLFELYCEPGNCATYRMAFIRYVKTYEPDVDELLGACAMLVLNYVKDIDKYFLV